MLTDMKIAGRTMPVLMMAVYEEPGKPFGYLTEALDQLQPGIVNLFSYQLITKLKGMKICLVKFL
jgi:4-hydroxy-4-methyl-2-oxoglutarate aldolase